MEDDDLFAALSGSDDPADDDDLFASLDTPADDETPGDSPALGTDADDPFAALDAVSDDDPFAPVGAPPATEDDAGDLLEADIGLPPLVTTEPAEAARPEWLRELSGFEEEEFEDEPEAPAVPRAPGVLGTILSSLVGRGPQGIGFGMTAQQRMVLSIFLFLDVAAIGCMLLIAIGAVNIGF
jgi:hypothetical protein